MLIGTNKLRPTVKKLGGNSASGEAGCGDANLVSGGILQAGDTVRTACDSAGQAKGENQAAGAGCSTSGGSQVRLAEASGEVLTALRAAKEELAKELEANLKQLKSVLEETQRIQKQMEAVLKETQCAPSLEERAKGKEGPPAEKRAGQADNQKQAAQDEQWQIPATADQAAGQRQKGGQQSAGASGDGNQAAEQQPERQVPPWELLQLHPDEPPSWEPPDFTTPVGDGTPPPWSPPPEATQPQQQQPTP